MPERILLDTNILIEILNDPNWRDFLNKEKALWIFSVSSITVMELYALAGQSKEEEYQLDDMCRHLDAFPVTNFIAKHAGLLLRTRAKKKRPDILIAATALVNQIPLITKNVKDFRGIPGLKVQSTL